MTLNLAETSVVKSRPSIPHWAVMHALTLMHACKVKVCTVHRSKD